MADGKTVACLGCAVCKSVLFQVVAVPAANKGVFQNEVGPYGDTPVDTDRKVCGTCERALTRVSPPA
jgi:hypothetical protein